MRSSLSPARRSDEPDPAGVPLARSQPVPPSAGPAARAHTGLAARALEVPLVLKLVGANGLVLIAALAAVGATQAWSSPATAILLGALLVAFGVNVVLVWLALRPLAGLEDTARRVWLHGDFAARVPRSSLADRNMARIGRTLNLLLDGLTEDRARMRLLAAQVISAQDAERARIARELHDSTAQTLAAAKLQLQAATQATADPALTERLGTLRELVSDALEETRSLSHLLYPRVLDDLGLVAAVEWLARHAREGGALGVEVETDVRRTEIPKTAASVLYRVAQEGLRNAMTHAQATTVTLRVEADEDQATLEVADDGRGFDVTEAEARRPGMGLFAIRERVGLVDGTVEIYSVPGRGTRLSATVPLRERRD
ncbi:MAG TPA: sensor histidine kinase [Gemmatimonadaceae bacterium]|nr:sensor histidine kinase [Gemmatimonadaceae bacterium]